MTASDAAPSARSFEGSRFSEAEGQGVCQTQPCEQTPENQEAAVSAFSDKEAQVEGAAGVGGEKSRSAGASGGTAPLPSGLDASLGPSALGYASRLSDNPNKGPVGRPEKRETPKTFLRKAGLLLAEVQRRVQDQLARPTFDPPAVAHTGAGISTSAGIPDFRGPSGVWTVEKSGMSLRDAEASICEVVFGGERRAVVPFHLALPTSTHLVLQALSQPQTLRLDGSSSTRLTQKWHMRKSTSTSDDPCRPDAGASPPLAERALRVFAFVITQNVDGLHAKCGTRFSALAEVHGSLFVERCDSCGRRFLREFPLPTLSFTPTGHLCGLCAFPPEGVCTDVLLDWFDAYEPHFLNSARRHSRRAGLHLCLGSSLQIQPACFFPSKERRRDSTLAICNLQTTPLDAQALVCVRSPVDALTESLAEGLGLKGGWGWRCGGRFGGLGMAERTGFETGPEHWRFSEFMRTALVFVLRIPCACVPPLIRAEGPDGLKTPQEAEMLPSPQRSEARPWQSFLVCAPCCSALEAASPLQQGDKSASSPCGAVRVQSIDSLRGVWLVVLCEGSAATLNLRCWYNTRAELRLLYSSDAAGIEADVWQMHLACTPQTHASSLPPSIEASIARRHVPFPLPPSERAGAVSWLPSESVVMQPPYEPQWPSGVSVRKARLVGVLTTTRGEGGGAASPSAQAFVKEPSPTRDSTALLDSQPSAETFCSRAEFAASLREGRNALEEGGAFEAFWEEDFTCTREVTLPRSMKAVFVLHCLCQEACADSAEVARCRQQQQESLRAKKEGLLNQFSFLRPPEDPSSSNASTDNSTPKQYAKRNGLIETVLEEQGAASSASSSLSLKGDSRQTLSPTVAFASSSALPSSPPSPPREAQRTPFPDESFQDLRSPPRQPPPSAAPDSHQQASTAAARRRSSRPSKRFLERDEKLPRRTKTRNKSPSPVHDAAEACGFPELRLPSVEEEKTLPRVLLSLRKGLALEGPSSLPASAASLQLLSPRLVVAKDWSLGCLAEGTGNSKAGGRPRPTRRFCRKASFLAGAVEFDASKGKSPEAPPPHAFLPFCGAKQQDSPEARRARLVEECSALAARLLSRGSEGTAVAREGQDFRTGERSDQEGTFFVEAGAAVWRSLRGLPLWTLNFLVDLVECV